MGLETLIITEAWTDVSTARNFEDDATYGWQANQTIAMVQAADEPDADLDGPRLKPWTDAYVKKNVDLKWWVRVVSGESPANLYPWKTS